jgi:hypothetical protein
MIPKCTDMGIANVQSLGWKGKKTQNWASKTPLERSSNLDA